MPNWCSSTIKFYSKDESEVRKMLDRFVEIYNGEPAVENGFGSGFMGNYAHAFFPEVQLEKIRCRGAVDIEKEVRKLNDYYYFTMCTETAWAPLIGLWYGIVEKFYKSIEIAYISEECGCGVFVKWDKTDGQVFFPDTFYVDGCLPIKGGQCKYIEDRYQFGTMEDIWKFFDEQLPFEYKHEMNVDALEEEIQGKLDEYSAGDDYEESLYVQISEFAEVSPSEHEMYH